MKRWLVLTGATGFLGTFLLRDLLLAGEPIAVVVRASSDHLAEQRIDRLLREWEERLDRSLPRPLCFAGDIAQENLGLGTEARVWMRTHAAGLLHNAASVTFHGGERGGEPWLSNYVGARNVLEFCHTARIAQLQWISTAYVCGDHPGPFYEAQLDCGQQFRNDYEESKFAGERLVHKATFLDQRTIYRPSIIVGDYDTGYTSSYHHIYHFLRFTWLLWQRAVRDAAGRWRHPMRLQLSGDEPLNLVPVDWVSKAILALMSQTQDHLRTYHLTHPAGTSTREFEASLASYFNYEGLEFVGPDAASDIREWSKLELRFQASVDSLLGYAVRPTQFDRTNLTRAIPHLPCPPIDRASLFRMFDYAVRNRFGEPAASAAPGADLYRDTAALRVRQGAHEE